MHRIAPQWSGTGTNTASPQFRSVLDRCYTSHMPPGMLTQTIERILYRVKFEAAYILDSELYGINAKTPAGIVS